jgi:LuxR family maltose regulon positive regulatory protein
MIKTCLFDAFSLDVASCLTGQASLTSQIQFLTDRHLISEIRSGDMPHYSYHPLLREFLRGRVMLLSEEERNKLVLQVGQSMRDKKEFDQAIDLYLFYGHFDEAIRLIERIGLGYTLEGRHSRLG